eukprot:c15824_g1_i1 orf=181-501(+)
MEREVTSFNSFGWQGEQPHHYWPKKNVLQSGATRLDAEASPVGIIDASSNVQRFLQHTTPRVPAQFLPKTHLRSVCSQGSDRCEMGFFSLNDLWDSFDEWSAYGAG